MKTRSEIPLLLGGMEYKASSLPTHCDKHGQRLVWRNVKGKPVSECSECLKEVQDGLIVPFRSQLRGTPSVLKPRRVQRKQTKGWRLPPNTVCVTRPGKWGNPLLSEAQYVRVMEHLRRGVGKSLMKDTPKEVIDHCWRQLNDMHELRGKNLACWCEDDESCHATYLLRLANSARVWG